MKRQALGIALMILAVSGTSWADGQKTEAAIGGGVGGATGAVIGEELGDREGAIIGAAVGAAVGTAIATDDEGVPVHTDAHAGDVHVDVSASGHPHQRHCPPGQAKKGRC